MDQVAPLYQVPLVKKRILIPKTLTLIILSGLFYAGILINISLLKLDSDVEGTAKFAGIGIVILLFFLGLILNFTKAKHGIKFYNDHLEIGHQKIQYVSLTTVEYKQGLLDKMFKTYTLRIDKKHKVEAISQNVNVVQYLQQLINYAKSQQTGQFQQNKY
tara:strand:- start:5729 stop:6208 length:480 start_codon:yes stop_codon:yes gene_type:complete